MEEEILNLIKAGYTQKKIAEIKGVKEETISRRIAKIDTKKVEEARKEGQEPRKEARQKSIKKRQEARKEAREAKEQEILNLIKAGYMQKDIAEMQGMTEERISTRIAGIDTKKVEEARKEGQEAKEQEILNLIRVGYTQRKIAEMKGVTEQTITRRIAKIDTKKVEEVRKEGQEARKEARQKSIEKRQEKRQEAKQEIKEAKEEEILNLIKAGYTQRKIAEMQGVTEQTISMKIAKIDTKKVEEARKEGQEARKETRKKTRKEGQEAREEEILNLIKAGYTQMRIAEIQEVTRQTISTRIAEIDAKKVEKARKEAKEAKEEEILNLIKAGYIQKDIAEIQGVTEQTISKRIAEIDAKKVEAARQEAKQAKENLNLRKNIEQKLEENTITNQDIKAYREYLVHQIPITLDEIKFMVKIYIKTNQPTNAIEFINSIINDGTINSLDKNKLLELKKQIIKIKNIQLVRKLLRSKMPTKEIAQKIGISEEEVIQIKRQIEAKKGPEI